MEISLRSNLKEIQKDLNRIVKSQIPYANAIAATELAQLVADAELDNMERVLDRPTPFTKRSVGVRKAFKDVPEAIVYVKDIAAEYLLPYEFGGRNKLNSKALLKPVGLPTNQYGNLNRRQLAQLKARSDVFIGEVRTSKGQVINGVWQRPNDKGKGKLANTSGHLRLLIRFDDAHPVTQHLGWHALASRVVASNYRKVFGRALGRALATAR